MEKRILFLAFISATFLFLNSQSFAQSETERMEIRAEIETLEQRLTELGNFSEEVSHGLKEETSTGIFRDIMLFEIRYLDLMFSLLVTEAVFDRMLGEEPPDDPLIELQMQTLPSDMQARLRFVKERLGAIRDGIDALEKEKKLQDSAKS